MAVNSRPCCCSRACAPGKSLLGASRTKWGAEVSLGAYVAPMLLASHGGSPLPALICGDLPPKDAKAKIAMVTQGTRGDFQPYVALCIQLRAAGYHVRCYAYKNHADQAKQYGLEFFPVRSRSAIFLHTPWLTRST